MSRKIADVSVDVLTAGRDHALCHAGCRFGYSRSCTLFRDLRIATDKGYRRCSPCLGKCTHDGDGFATVTTSVNLDWNAKGCSSSCRWGAAAQRRCTLYNEPRLNQNLADGVYHKPRCESCEARQIEVRTIAHQPATMACPGDDPSYGMSRASTPWTNPAGGFWQTDTASAPKDRLLLFRMTWDKGMGVLLGKRRDDGRWYGSDCNGQTWDVASTDVISYAVVCLPK